MTDDQRGAGAHFGPTLVPPRYRMGRGCRLVRALVVALVAGASSSTFAQEADQAVRDQWFTGSLEAPSPALSKAGAFEIEPYGLFNLTTGAFNGRGTQRATTHDPTQAQSVTLFKYGLTDRLTIETLPSFTRAQSDQGTSQGSGLGDLPVELQYRFIDQNGKTGSPSVTAGLGMSFPLGSYDHLGNALDGLGTGAYTLKEDLLLQSLFDTWGDHPMRLRLFGAAYEAVDGVSVRGRSVYGTLPGFNGRVNPGFTADVGIGAEYGLTQKWVLALDVIQNYGRGFALTGSTLANVVVQTGNVTNGSTVIAPAIEYNWSSSAGIIVGAAFSAAGKNTSSSISPQVAISLSF